MDKDIAKGFDRDLDFEDIKKRLCLELKILKEKKRTKFVINKICYVIIALIQLRNGSRISEAVKAFIEFKQNGINDKVIVKISKSEALKYNKLKGKKVLTKARYRKMMFPTWIEKDVWEDIIHSELINELVECKRLKKRVLDYLLKYFKCNTHSLRYAFINYLLYVEKRPMNDVAKFVGHVNVNQLVTYTQHKNCEQIFNLNI